MVAEHLAHFDTGWAIGMVGAVAEFTRSAAERVVASDATSLVTTRGGLRIDATPETRVVRFTLASGLACIALCLPEARACLHRRAVLSEVGRDDHALRSSDRDACLFDLGVRSAFFDFCIRTDDAAAVRLLRQWVGTPLFTAGGTILGEIAAMQPHRIACSRLGRIEVYAPIADPGTTTPTGPHTHLLPDRLTRHLNFEMDEPIPQGWIPCVHLYVGQLPVHENGIAAHAAHRDTAPGGTQA